MNEPILLIISQFFIAPLIAAVIASYITYFFSKRRYIDEKWWDRKADAYTEIIKTLVTLKYSYEKWLEYEFSDNYDKEFSKNVRTEILKSTNSLERVVIERNFVISEQSIIFLTKLINIFRESSFELTTELQIFTRETDHCIKEICQEAKSVLHVK